ncbi:MAG: hypothetical protein IT561_14295 [Alphaproteobacteria bacterium]|nr:hypothetical protein [Alphaproteobacteria bacterium]
MLVNDPASAHYEIDPDRVDLVAEFRRNPKGPHSDGLRKVLHRMRWSGAGGRYVLVVLDPGRRWALGRLPERRGAPVELFRNQVFDDVGTAEWHVFKLRWQALTGRTIED